MRIFYILFVLLCLGTFTAAQTLPNLDIPVKNGNYRDICTYLDQYFAIQGSGDETDCPDNNYMKYQRWKWFWQDRVDAAGRFPDLKSQWMAARDLRQVALSRGNGPQWINEGPTEVVHGGYWGIGRTKHIAFHPQDPFTFFVGTPDGGLWKTTDWGTTWAPLGDALPYLPVSVILIDYLHPDTMYISLGDKGGWWHWNLGVYKSTDGGLTWQATGLDWQLSQENVIYNLVMHPTDPQIIYAATNKGIRRTQDGGDTWTTVAAGEYTDVEFRPGDGLTLYAARHNYWQTSQVVKSVDGGETWQQMTNFQTTNNDIRIAVTPANPDFVGLNFGNGKAFWLSKDAGQTFEERSVMPENWQISFSPVDTNVVYACGVVVHRSTDQGLTWTQITNWWNNGQQQEVHADVHDVVFSPHSQEEVWFCNDGGVYMHHEPTETWTDLSNGLGIAQFYSVAVSEGGNLKIAAGSQDNGGWFRMSDGSWKHTNGGDAMTQIIDPTNSNIHYTEYYGGNAIYRSVNNTQNYITISDNLEDDPSGAWVTPFMLNPKRPQTFIVGFHDLYRSYDRGDHFHKLTENLTGSVDTKIRSFDICRADTNSIAVAFGRKVKRTTNGGQSWNTYTAPYGEDITQIIYAANDPKRLWISRAGYSSQVKVFKSENYGQTWQNISQGMPNVPVNCILFDTLTNYLFAGTDIGVFYSDADSIAWKLYGEGMPAVIVLDMKVRQSTRKLYVATHGRGVYAVDLELVTRTVDPVAGASKLVVAPNPVSGETLLVSRETDDIQHADIVDIQGRVVARVVLKGRQTRIPVSQLHAGVWALRTERGQLVKFLRH